MLPVVALVGRPNVGKSTLFNVLTRTRDALVADMPGVTRDRHYGICRIGERPFVVVDTGGLADSEEGLAGLTARQVELAIAEANVVVFVVDARDGLLPTDQAILDRLRRTSKPLVLAVNKVDGLNESIALADFARLGVAAPLPLSASNNQGTRDLLEAVDALLPEGQAELGIVPLHRVDQLGQVLVADHRPEPLVEIDIGKQESLAVAPVPAPEMPMALSA